MSKRDVDSRLVEAIEKHAFVLGGALSEYDPIISAARDKQFVLIGEASHGTGEFYRTRAEITRRLIEEEGFDAVAVEADWPDAYAINRFVSGGPTETSATEVLAVFERFPTWMWANHDILHFIEWLAAHNQFDGSPPVGFYGLDLYSMNSSIHAVIEYLDKIDPAAASRARLRYSCLDQFMDEPAAYGHATEMGLSQSCEEDIIDQLTELRHKAYDYMRLDGFVLEEEHFCAEQNAKLVRNAEGYYRSMFGARANSWNVRDRHMFETLEDLAAHLGDRIGREARIVVWAHNSHIGNAAATEMSRRGELNIGQLAREAFGDKVLLVGFSTCRGTVSAASNWNQPVERKKVSEPFPGSYEHVFHHVNHKRFMIDLRAENEAVYLLREERLQRAIGVIYRPESERESHYFYADLPQQFDFMIHIDETTAVRPLDIPTRWQKAETEETYPTGL